MDRDKAKSNWIKALQHDLERRGKYRLDLLDFTHEIYPHKTELVLWHNGYGIIQFYVDDFCSATSVVSEAFGLFDMRCRAGR